MKRKLPKRARRRKRVAMPAATAENHRWSMTFIHDQLVDGRHFRVLNIIDDFTRKVVVVEVDTSISGGRVARVLDGLAVTRGLPRMITCDNSTEFTSKAMQARPFDRMCVKITLNLDVPPKMHMRNRSIAGCATNFSIKIYFSALTMLV